MFGLLQFSADEAHIEITEHADPAMAERATPTEQRVLAMSEAKLKRPKRNAKQEVATDGVSAARQTRLGEWFQKN